jgi:hypothetical protein
MTCLAGFVAAVWRATLRRSRLITQLRPCQLPSDSLSRRLEEGAVIVGKDGVDWRGFIAVRSQKLLAMFRRAGGERVRRHVDGNHSFRTFSHQ